MAKRRHSYQRPLPRNQYNCGSCGRRHVHGSQRGKDCRGIGRRPRSAPALNSPPLRTEHQPKPRQQPSGNGAPVSRRQRARDVLANAPSGVYSDAIAFVFDRDAFYRSLADRVIDHLPWHRRAQLGHWLCRQLDDVAKAVTPDTYTAGLRGPMSAALQGAGAPGFIAEAFAAAGVTGMNTALSTVLPTSQLTSTLRVLIPLTCPDFENCPAVKDVAKEFASPILADELQRFAERHRPGSD